MYSSVYNGAIPSPTYSHVYPYMWSQDLSYVDRITAGHLIYPYLGISVAAAVTCPSWADFPITWPNSSEDENFQHIKLTTNYCLFTREKNWATGTSVSGWAVTWLQVPSKDTDPGSWILSMDLAMDPELTNPVQLSEGWRGANHLDRARSGKESVAGANCVYLDGHVEWFHGHELVKGNSLSGVQITYLLPEVAPPQKPDIGPTYIDY